MNSLDVKTFEKEISFAPYHEDVYRDLITDNKSNMFARYFAKRYIDKHSTVIELGCWNGRDSIEFLNNWVKRIIAIDKSKFALLHFSKKLRELNDELVTILDGDFREMLEHVSNFDWINTVYSHSSLHYYSDDEFIKIVTLVYKLLCSSNWYFWLAIKAPWSDLDWNWTRVECETNAWLNSDGYIRYFRNAETLKEIFKNIGFKICSFRTDRYDNYTSKRKTSYFYYIVLQA